MLGNIHWSVSPLIDDFSFGIEHVTAPSLGWYTADMNSFDLEHWLNALTFERCASFWQKKNKNKYNPLEEHYQITRLNSSVRAIPHYKKNRSRFFFSFSRWKRNFIQLVRVVKFPKNKGKKKLSIESWKHTFLWLKKKSRRKTIKCNSSSKYNLTFKILSNFVRMVSQFMNFCFKILFAVESWASQQSLVTHMSIVHKTTMTTTITTSWTPILLNRQNVSTDGEEREWERERMKWENVFFLCVFIPILLMMMNFFFRKL